MNRFRQGSTQRSAVCIALVGVIGATGYLLYSAPAAAQNNPGRDIAGAYVSAFDYGGVPLLATAQLQAGGTLVLSDQSDFGVADGIHNAPAYGSWEWNGPRSIVATALALCFDDTGAPAGVLRLTFNTEFDRGFNTAHSVVEQRFYLPGEDALDPEQGAPGTPPVLTCSSRRVAAR